MEHMTSSTLHFVIIIYLMYVLNQKFRDWIAMNGRMQSAVSMLTTVSLVPVITETEQFHNIRNIVNRFPIIGSFIRQ